MSLPGITPQPHKVSRALQIAGRASEFGSPLSVFRNLLQVVEFYPWRLDLLEFAGRSAIQGGALEAGIELLQHVSRFKQLDATSQIALGDAALRQSNSQLAIAAYTTALHAGGDPLILYDRMAQARRTMGDFAAAIKDLESLAALQPTSPQIAVQLGLLYASQEPEAAITYLTRAVELDPSLEPEIQSMRRSLRTARLSDDKAYTLLIAGRELASLGEWDLAEEAFRRATVFRRDYAEAWAFLAESRQHLSTTNQLAYEDLRKALTLDPDSVVANTLMALYWQRQARDDLSLVYLHAALAAEPDNPTLHIELGDTLAGMGEIGSAHEYFRQAVDLAPDNPVYWRYLASFSVNYDIDVRQVGLPAARQALVLDPDDPASLDVMGQVLTLLDDPVSAQRFYRRALRNDPGFAPARLHLGFLFLLQGDAARAHQQLTLARSLAPPHHATALQAARLLEQYFP